jgi:hypothetical protein
MAGPVAVADKGLEATLATGLGVVPGGDIVVVAVHWLWEIQAGSAALTTAASPCRNLRREMLLGIERSIPQLESHSCSGVLTEEEPLTDIPADYGYAAVPGLGHDRPLTGLDAPLLR